MMGLFDKLPPNLVQNALQMAEIVREQATLIGKDALKELDRLKEQVKTNAETVGQQMEGVRFIVKEQAKAGSAELKRRWQEACERWGAECKESIHVDPSTTQSKQAKTQRASGPKASAAPKTGTVAKKTKAKTKTASSKIGSNNATGKPPKKSHENPGGGEIS